MTWKKSSIFDASCAFHIFFFVGKATNNALYKGMEVLEPLSKYNLNMIGNERKEETMIMHISLYSIA